MAKCKLSLASWRVNLKKFVSDFPNFDPTLHNLHLKLAYPFLTPLIPSIFKTKRKFQNPLQILEIGVRRRCMPNFTGIGLLDLKLNSLECSQQESPKMSVFFFRLLLEKGPENWRQRPRGDEMMSVGQHIADEVACRDIPSFARLLILWLSITCTTMSWTCTVQHAGYCMHVRTAHVHIADRLTTHDIAIPMIEVHVYYSYCW